MSQDLSFLPLKHVGVESLKPSGAKHFFFFLKIFFIYLFFFFSLINKLPSVALQLSVCSRNRPVNNVIPLGLQKIQKQSLSKYLTFI